MPLIDRAVGFAERRGEQRDAAAKALEQRFGARTDIARGRRIEGGALFEEDLPRASFDQPVRGLQHLAHRIAGCDDAGLQQDHMGKIA